MRGPNEPISDEAARAIWRRAARLQAEAERRMEERARQIAPAARDEAGAEDGMRADDVRAAAEEAGISPEFVQIAMAEAAASSSPASAPGRWDVAGARLFLRSSHPTIEASAVVRGSVPAVSAAVLQVFSGHPCLLNAGEVADLPNWSGRVIVFNVPEYDWGATANPPFVEKASMIGLRQVYVALRPVPDEPGRCEVVVAGDLQPGMRSRWRWGAATSAGGAAAGGAVGAGLAAPALAGALLALPALAGALVIGGASVGLWAGTYRYYRKKVEEALEQSLTLLPTAVRALAVPSTDPIPSEKAIPAGERTLLSD